jgi:hypothetical protein
VKTDIHWADFNANTCFSLKNVTGVKKGYHFMDMFTAAEIIKHSMPIIIGLTCPSIGRRFMLKSVLWNAPRV